MGEPLCFTPELFSVTALTSSGCQGQRQKTSLLQTCALDFPTPCLSPCYPFQSEIPAYPKVTCLQNRHLPEARLPFHRSPPLRQVVVPTVSQHSLHYIYIYLIMNMPSLLPTIILRQELYLLHVCHCRD